MTWVKLDDAMPDHPKVAPLTDAAFRHHVHGLCYCARSLTDGFIPKAVADRLTARGKRGSTELVSAGIWDDVDGGYEVHDYAEYQPSRAQVLEQRAKTAERVNRHRYNKPRNAVTPPVSNAVGSGTPQPNPTQPQHLPQGQPNPKVDGDPVLTISRNGKPAAHAAEQLLERIPNATPGTARRFATFLSRGAAEVDFHDAREALRQKQPPPKNPAAWACGIIDERLKARQR